MKFHSDRATPLYQLLQIKIGGSLTKIKKRVAQEEVYIDGVKTLEHNPMIPKGSVVEFRQKKSLPHEGIQILFEDKELIAVAKPVGMLSIKNLGDKDQTLFGKVNRYLSKKAHRPERAFIVHRLDQKVSGVIVFAKSKATEAFFKKHWYDFTKTYHALVEGSPEHNQGTRESWLQEDSKHKVHSGEERAESKHAITHYRIEKRFKRTSLMAIRLATGRKNQIRVHMADLGCPIVGDFKYGASSNPIGRIGLHAHTMELTHPKTGESLVINDPTPDCFFK